MNAELRSYMDDAVMEDQPRYAMDKRLYVRFHTEPVLNNFKSAQEGRPIYDEKDFIQIIIPGDKNSILDTPVTPEYKMRFREKYDAFKKGKEMAQTGTPLEMWPQMTVGLVAELKAMHVSTVEQLAELSDTLAQRIMGAHSWRQKAQAFLDAAKGEAVNTKMAAELEKRDLEIATLKEQMKQFFAQQAKKTAKE